MLFENEGQILRSYLDSYRPIEEKKIGWEQLGDYPALSEELRAVLDYIEMTEGHIREDARFIRASPAYRFPVIRAFVDVWEEDEALHAELIARARTYLNLPSLRPPPATRVSKLKHEVVLLAAEAMPETFVKLYLLIAATHELITRYTYTHFRDLCGNPVLGSIFLAIAEQESRHFMFYYRMAELFLKRSPRGRRILRWNLGRYTLVGEGVQGKKYASKVIHALTTDPEGQRLARLVDHTMQKLPGLEELPIFMRRVEKAFASLR